VGFTDGTVRNTWCTFSEEQIDIDVFSQCGRRWLEEELGALCRHPGIRTIRLDAAGYATKKPGTRFFFEEPEILDLFSRCKAIAAPHGVELLPEIHEHYSYQQKLSGWDMAVYDFALPMLLLHALYSGDGTPLARWLRMCPKNCVTTLDTHDGIGVVDVTDLLSPEQIQYTVDALYQKGSSVNRRYSSASYGNLDIYQINCTYYSALGEDDEAYLLARAVQFFAPGIPQMYYVGLLAGRNDIGLVERTLQGRDINRHGYTAAEVEEEMRRPVVQRLLRLMEFRNSHPAFSSNELSVQSLLEGRKMLITRQSGEHQAVLEVDFPRRLMDIRISSGGRQENFRI
jgi:sucrose phosphorylase